MLAPVEASGQGKRPGTELRRGARQRLTLRVAKLRCLSGEYPCILHDVSEGGARVRLFHAHPPETHMFLELANGELYAIERRWTDGDFAGYRFSSRVEVEEFLHEPCMQPRRPLRLRIEHPVRYAATGELGHAHLVNLSSQGACMESGRQLALGTLLRLELAGAEPRFAHVCWRKDFRHGLAFQETLPLAELARIAFELQPFDASALPAFGGEDPLQAIGG